jgi:hypothetical protein
MHTILLYTNGRRAEGIILAASEDSMRVIVRRRTDTVELRRVGGVWTCEDGSPIQFESLVMTGDSSFNGLGNFESRPRTLTAGGQAFLTA